MCSLAFRSKSGSGKRSRDNATFRRNLLGTAFAWQMRSRYAAGEGAQRDFQTAGLNGVFGYFCRRGQKYPAPGRGISLWTIPPSTRSADASLAEGGEGALRACGRGGVMWASPPTDGFKECGALGGQGRPTMRSTTGHSPLAIFSSVSWRMAARRAVR